MIQDKLKAKYQTLKEKLTTRNIKKIIPTVLTIAALTAGGYFLGNYKATQKYKALHNSDYLMIAIDDTPREKIAAPGRVRVSFSVGGKRFNISDLERYDPLMRPFEDLKRNRELIEKSLCRRQEYNHLDKNREFVDPRTLFNVSFFVNDNWHYINRNRHGKTISSGNQSDHIRILIEPKPVDYK